MNRVMGSAMRRGSLAVAMAAVVLAVAAPVPTCFAQGQGLREIYDEKDEGAQGGFVDLSLGIESMKCDAWNDCWVRASGRFRGARVAVEVSIRARGGAGEGTITYRSVGPDSDALLAAMATLYRRPLAGKASFSKAATADIVFLDADAQRMAGKVFFAANGPESAYAELYTNVDKRRGVLEIHEKDEEYRENVLKGLAGGR